MRVMALGLRGFPGIQGGVETHAEQLYPRLRDLGCDVEVVVRSPYWPAPESEKMEGLRFRSLWCPRIVGAEAFVHSFLGVLYAGIRRPDVLHIHAIGPAIFAPLAKLLGLRVVVTHHGPDYDREKWSPFARFMLRTGERFGMRFSDERIVISQVIRDLVREKHGRDSVCIPNGVEAPSRPQTTEALRSFDLTPGRYVLNVSRMVPEKRHLDLIQAFEQAELDGFKLVLVGSIDSKDAYVDQVIDAANRSPHVVLTGFQRGARLGELYDSASVFALPSTHEGLPIALLEALSYGIPAIASDIPANKEVGLPDDQYFTACDPADMARCLRRLALAPRGEDDRRRLEEWVTTRYDWQRIACRTREVYRAAARDDRRR